MFFSQLENSVRFVTKYINSSMRGYPACFTLDLSRGCLLFEAYTHDIANDDSMDSAPVGGLLWDATRVAVGVKQV